MCRPSPSHLPPHPIPQGCPSALALSALFHASNLDWWSISHMVISMLQWFSLKSSHPHLLPQSPKVCSLYLCLFCCLAYRVIVTIFLNSLYICFNIILHCVYVTQLSYPFICRWTSRLLPCPGYYKQCCDEHWGYTCLFPFWFPRCVRPAVGLLGRMAVLFPVF